MEARGVEEILIPYVGQLTLTNVPVEGWIIDHYKQGDVPLTFPQSSFHTPLCTPHHTPTYCTCTCILLHFSL